MQTFQIETKQAETKEEDQHRLAEFSRSLLRNRCLILASNRGPVEHHLSHGELQVTRGSGGVVTALSSLGGFVPFTWVASAMGDGDRRAARMARGQHIPVSSGEQELFLRYVVTRRNVYQQYYNVFSNPFLWFLQHSMWDLPYEPNVDSIIYDAWEKGYMRVNRAFAAAIVNEAMASGRSPVILLHDYHLYLVGGMVRQALPDALIQHFVHIPWPSSGDWTILPKHIRSAILESLCSCDVVGFQTNWDARNFLLCCRDLVSEAQVDFSSYTVRFQGHTVYVHNYPVSINVNELRELAESPVVEEYVGKLRSLISEKTIVRVDRLEPSKNILRGFRAYEMLLGRYPDLLGKVTFLAFLVPSRTEIREYQRYKDAVMDIVQRINSTFSQSDWTPIHLFYEENYPQAIAGMRLCDVLLVNPVVDGMNLVAKEGPIVSTRNGVLVLSERAGAYEQLEPGVIPVSPVDIEGTTRALHEALTMSRRERVRRCNILRRIIEEEDLTHWLYRQLEDLDSLAPGKPAI